MNIEKNQFIEEKNRVQIAYFESRDKKTMLRRPSPYIFRHIQKFIEFFPLPKNEPILEVGCGAGRYTIPLRQLGYEIEGLDLSAKLLEKLRTIANGSELNIPLYAHDIHSEPPNELKERYSIIIAFFTLHHLANLEEAFLQMRKFLKANGKICFLEPNPNNLLYYFQILLTPGMSFKGEVSFFKMRPKIIEAALTKAGFGNFSYQRFGFLPPALLNLGLNNVESLLENIPLITPCLPFQLFSAKVLAS
ncbi:MAG TPA: class I SAM-dependent methyltransferase [Oligoflexia bacterium]|mgnify:CR=1 FL=1|nr:class I SAM-dependent methyltransferase [Oligoflexia bacterium]HMP27285.1 class I SAM-dependent methyltransferase [Oligoflexia bacterium]